MDLIEKAVPMVAGSGDTWTEEMHASFLNRIEESFVRTVLLGFGGAAAAAVQQRLDRYVPDSATESTRDFQSYRRTAALMGSGRRYWATRNHTSAKKRPHTQCDSSQDQVVPHFETTTKAEKAASGQKGNKKLREA